MTNAPADKIYMTASNGNFRFEGITKSAYKGDEYDYCFTFNATKTGLCDLSIYLNDRLMDTWHYNIVNNDDEYGDYDGWFKQVTSKMGAKWSGVNSLQKVTNLGQYLLDNYNYGNGLNSGFHINGKGDCGTATDVLVRTAMGLGLKAEAVVQSSWASKDPTHVVARVWYNGKAYLIDAGNKGKAGKRGNVSCIEVS